MTENNGEEPSKTIAAPPDDLTTRRKEKDRRNRQKLWVNECISAATYKTGRKISFMFEYVFGFFSEQLKMI